VGFQRNDDRGISDQALIGIICGCIAFVLLVSIVCFIVYRRQKKQIEEYKELYFLRTGTSDYKVSLVLNIKANFIWWSWQQSNWHTHVGVC